MPINVSNDVYNRGAAITPDDATNEATPFDAIHCGAAGTIVVVLETGATVTLAGCLAGHVYRVRGIRVNNTSTTASSLVGLRYA